MKYLAILVLLLVAACPLWGDMLYFYGGDFSYYAATARDSSLANGLANETDGIVGGSPYGAAVYQNFVVSSYGINVSRLFTNNLSQLTPTSGYWEIRTGVSEGNGGTLIASGDGAVTNTPTGRSGFGYTEYQNLVGGLSVYLPAGTYWFAVVPNCTTCFGRSFNTNTLGRNSVGTTVPNQQYWNSSFFGANFTNAENEGEFPRFSSGVYIFSCGEGGACSLSQATEAPEPSTLMMFGSSFVGAATAMRRFIPALFRRTL